MTRSAWKHPHISPKLELMALENESQQILKTYERSATITPELISTKVRVHNGCRFVVVAVTENHVGFKFGQFVLTRKKGYHKKKQIKKNKK
jgi:small subunit ribosomal protein S19